MSGALVALLAGCAAAQAASEVPDAGGAAAPADPLASVRTLLAARLEPASLDAAITRLEALSGTEAELMEVDALLFRAAWNRAQHGTRDSASLRGDAARARVLTLRIWEGIDPGASSKLDPTTLPSALAGATPPAGPALVRLARADWDLAPLLGPTAGTVLRREALAVAARATELAPPSETSAARQLWATGLAVLPRSAGGDFARGRFDLEEGIAASPGDLAGRVEEAARVAVKAKDRALFRALLQSALAADPDEPAPRAPERHLARLHALWLAHHQRALLGR